MVVQELTFPFHATLNPSTLRLASGADSAPQSESALVSVAQRRSWLICASVPHWRAESMWTLRADRSRPHG